MMRLGAGLRRPSDGGHAAAARVAVVEVLLGDLVAPVAEPECLDGPVQLSLGGLRRQDDPDDLELFAGLAVAIDTVRLGLDDELAAGRGCPHAITLRHAAAHFTCAS